MTPRSFTGWAVMSPLLRCPPLPLQPQMVTGSAPFVSKPTSVSVLYGFMETLRMETCSFSSFFYYKLVLKWKDGS